MDWDSRQASYGATMPTRPCCRCSQERLCCLVFAHYSMRAAGIPIPSSPLPPCHCRLQVSSSLFEKSGCGIKKSRKAGSREAAPAEISWAGTHSIVNKMLAKRSQTSNGMDGCTALAGIVCSDAVHCSCACRRSLLEMRIYNIILEMRMLTSSSSNGSLTRWKSSYKSSNWARYRCCIRTRASNNLELPAICSRHFLSMHDGSCC